MYKEYPWLLRVESCALRISIFNLEYKNKWNNKKIIKVNRWYKSSQTCSICENVDSTYKKLGEKEYKCDKCQNKMDRDFNAAI